VRGADIPGTRTEETILNDSVDAGGPARTAKEGNMESSTVRIDGTVWFFLENGKGRPVLLVHGNTGSSTWWERILDLPGCRCVAPDIPNFGRSGPLGRDITIDTYADSLADFIDAKGLKGAVAVGHSLGGSVCLSLAARHAESIGGLVLVDSSSPRGLSTPEASYPAIEAMRTNRSILEQALKAVVPTLVDDVLFGRLVDDAMRMAAPAWIGNARALSAFDVSGRLGGWTKPVLVLWGRKDVLITEAMARETAAAFRNARLEILEEVGHSAIVEDPDRFKQLLSQYLTTLPAAR